MIGDQHLTDDQWHRLLRWARGQRGLDPVKLLLRLTGQTDMDIVGQRSGGIVMRLPTIAEQLGIDAITQKDVELAAALAGLPVGQFTRMGLAWSYYDSFLPHQVAVADRMPHESTWYSSVFSHVMVVFEFDCGVRQVRESTAQRGVTITPWSKVVGCSKVTRLVLKWFPYVPESKIIASWDEADRLFGDGYNYLLIICLYWWIRYAGRDQIKWPKWFAQRVKNRYICANLTNVLCRISGIDVNGSLATDVTTTPNSQFTKLYGVPSGHPDAKQAVLADANSQIVRW